VQKRESIGDEYKDPPEGTLGGYRLILDVIVSPTFIISPRNSIRIAIPGIGWDGMDPNDAGGPDLGGRKI